MKQSYCDILENVELTPGTMRLTARDPEIAAASRPGQFVNVLCGQCLDPLLRRPFSIYTVNKDRGEFSLLYQVKGRGTVLLSQREAGEKLDVVGPIGRPFHIDPGENIEHILVGGGCGIVPLRFLADVLRDKFFSKTYVLEDGKATPPIDFPNSRYRGPSVLLMIGAQTKDAILCAHEFEESGLQPQLSTDDGTEGKQGYVTDSLSDYLADIEQGRKPRIYACGPHEMLKRVAKIAEEHNVPCQVSLESAMACGFGVCMGCVVKTRELHCATEGSEDWNYSRVCVDGPVFYTTELVWE